MTENDTSRVEIGLCATCGRTLRVKSQGLRKNMQLTCKCGTVNTIVVDQAILSQYSVKPVEVEIYQINHVSLNQLLDGPRFKSAVLQSHSTSNIIGVALTLYWSDQNALATMRTLVDRLKIKDKARPWSIELFRNGPGSMLNGSYFVVLGYTQIGGSSSDTWDTIEQITHNLQSDNPMARGGEWELGSEFQGDMWRNRGLLLQRWVFLDTDEIKIFRA